MPSLHCAAMTLEPSCAVLLSALLLQASTPSRRCLARRAASTLRCWRTPGLLLRSLSLRSACRRGTHITCQRATPDRSITFQAQIWEVAQASRSVILTVQHCRTTSRLATSMPQEQQARVLVRSQCLCHAAVVCRTPGSAGDPVKAGHKHVGGCGCIMQLSRCRQMLSHSTAGHDD